MTQLSVNLNKVALLRNQRSVGFPRVTDAAATCIEAGAHGITLHPRPDERHVRRGDVYDVAAMLKGADTEYNIEGNPFPEFMALVRDVRPTQCTLVPDDPHQATSDHGWDLVANGEQLWPIIAELKELGIRVSLFMDPQPATMKLAKALGADRVELYTESYASAFVSGNPKAVFEQFAEAARNAQACGLGVNAGHDLNLENLPLFQTIPDILECSIGHALIADSLFMGLGNAVGKYVAVLRDGASAETVSVRGDTARPVAGATRARAGAVGAA